VKKTPYTYSWTKEPILLRGEESMAGKKIEGEEGGEELERRGRGGGRKRPPFSNTFRSHWLKFDTNNRVQL